MRAAAVGPSRKQGLGEAFAGVGDDAVAGVQDGLGRPVVLFEPHYLCRWIEAAGEIEDVASILLGLKPDGAGVTVVGDDAQAIYSFRSATVRLHTIFIFI